MSLNDSLITRIRLSKSGLYDHFQSVEKCAYNLIGVQAQSLIAAALAIHNRTGIKNISEFNQKLFVTKELVRFWGQRRTLHTYISSDWPIIYAAYQSRPSWWYKKALASGEYLDDYNQKIIDAEMLLREKGTLSRSDITDDFSTYDHLSSWGGIFADLEAKGVACHAITKGNNVYIAHRSYWLPHLEWNPPSTPNALKYIISRYVVQYGPATIGDLSYWLGISQQKIKSCISDLSGLGNIQFSGKRENYIISEEDIDLYIPQKKDCPTKVSLLSRYDPLLVAYKDKSWLIQPGLHKLIWREAGIIESVVIVHGKIIGIWNYERKGQNLVFRIRLFTSIDGLSQADLFAKCKEISEFMDLKLQDVIMGNLIS